MAATKIIVFDLDETLGYFSQFGAFMDCLYFFLQKDVNKLQNNAFHLILDLYPEFLRPKILTILNYLKYQKVDGNCYKLMIYTNNNGPKTWSQSIVNYFESKLNFKLFDQIISAFKINGQQVEMGRTSHDKHFNDLMKCTKIPNDAEILFLDNTMYKDMLHDSVYYIHLDPYYYMLPFEEMLKRFKQSTIGKQILQDEHISKFDEVMRECWKRQDCEFVRKRMKEYRLEKIVSKQIMILLQKFFKNELSKSNYAIVPVHVKTRRRRIGRHKRHNTTSKNEK